jgi:energy-coupling factor transport system substrate-specific component
VTWELAAFAVLGAALAAGFGWYERAQPGSRMLALVATLAALAALGRIAFAPLPNVKPTTDIVLIAGLALGAAPGFVVGAVAALASNLVFGQGPWTPWQMVAWGLCGVLGALLARAFGRDIGRVPLALACGAAGLMFGAGQQTLDQYWAISATSLPFNLAHAAGNVAFALAFGPALVRALLRYRGRLEVRWLEAAPAAPLLLVLLVGATSFTVGAQDARAATPARAAAGWLARAQNADGGWGSAPGARTNSLNTAWSVVGLAAAGHDPLRVRARGQTPRRLLRLAASRSRAIADVQRTALALSAAGMSPRTAGLDRRLRRAQRRDGSFGRLVNLTSYGLLALRAQGASHRASGVRRAAAWIARRQSRDGGFSFSGAGPSGTDDTAGALMALATARGAGDPRVRRAAAWLARNQNPDGGYALQPPGRSNAQSTALAVQALLAAGREPARQRRSGARSPLAYLRTLQLANGMVRYSRTSAQTPVWVTSQALAALARRPLPVVLRR